MNIWTVDGEAIRSEINARNAIRKAALLPILDEQMEFEHACMLIRRKRWFAFKESKEADYERFRDEVYTELGPPTDFSGRRSRHFCITKRFEACQLCRRDRRHDGHCPGLSRDHATPRRRGIPR